MSPFVYLLAAILAVYLPTSAWAHGRMLEPCGRMSCWLAYLLTPVYYEDHQMNCGGREVQWDQNGGKCGICGEPYQGTKRYERPDGIMVQHSVIAASYIEGDTIAITLQITAAHKGWMEFRICDIRNSGGVEATQECLDQTLLKDVTGMSRFTNGTTYAGFFTYNLVLPMGLTCKQCVIQWKWKCGNDWGCSNEGCCTGCGERQEEFYSCSDVIINSRSGNLPTTESPATALTPTSLSTTTTTTTTTTTQSTTTLGTTTRTIIPSTVSRQSEGYPLTTVRDTTTTTSTPTTKTSPTTTPTTVSDRKSTKSPASQTGNSKNTFFEEILKKIHKNVSDDNKISFSNGNNKNPLSKTNEDAFLKILITRNTAKGKDEGHTGSVIKNGYSSSNSTDPAEIDKDAKNNICAACWIYSHSFCNAMSPDICS